jgi:hypothetical protein
MVAETLLSLGSESFEAQRVDVEDKQRLVIVSNQHKEANFF